MRPSSVAVSIVAHAVALLAAVIVPLLATSDLPEIRNAIAPFMPAYHAGVNPSVPAPPSTTSASTRRSNRLVVPTEAPRGITEEKPLPPVVDGPIAPGGIETGPTPGLPSGFGTRDLDVAPPPPPPPTPRTTVPLRAGGRIRIPQRISYIAPVYPVIAQSAGVQGLVILDATIDMDGRVQNVRVLRSHPLLDQAAIDAVRQWRYTPTLLNGIPVPVVMTVTVDFRLTP